MKVFVLVIFVFIVVLRVRNVFFVNLFLVLRCVVNVWIGLIVF